MGAASNLYESHNPAFSYLLFPGNSHHLCWRTNCPRVPEHRLLHSGEKPLVTAAAASRAAETRESCMPRELLRLGGCEEAGEHASHAPGGSLAVPGLCSRCLSSLPSLGRESK